MWDTNFCPPEDLRALQVSVDDACATEHRDPATLGRSVSITLGVNGASNPYGMPSYLTGSAPELAEGLRAYAESGFSQVVIWLAPNTLAGIDSFVPVLDLLDGSTLGSPGAVPNHREPII